MSDEIRDDFISFFAQTSNPQLYSQRRNLLKRYLKNAKSATRVGFEVGEAAGTTMFGFDYSSTPDQTFLYATRAAIRPLEFPQDAKKKSAQSAQQKKGDVGNANVPDEERSRAADAKKALEKVYAKKKTEASAQDAADQELFIKSMQKKVKEDAAVQDSNFKKKSKEEDEKTKGWSKGFKV